MSVTRIKRGSPETWDFRFDYDITGHTVVFMIKEKETDTDANAIFTKTLTTHTDPTNGQTIFTQTGAETAAISRGVYYWAVKDFDSGGTPVKETATEQVEYTNEIVQALTA
jgi:hypothetical protein